jgi:hypothetical protein
MVSCMNVMSTCRHVVVVHVVVVHVVVVHVVVVHVVVVLFIDETPSVQFLCISVCMCVCIYMCMYVCTYVYKYNLEFINELSVWNASQINFTVGVHGSILSQAFTNKLLKLGVTESHLREEIRKKVGRRTLKMQDLMLRSYYQAKFSPTFSIDQIQRARTEKESRAIHHKLYLSFAHR